MLKKGFTLVELSIVLVIIGLIIGGILLGNDLINAATVRSQLSQIEKLNQAVNTFRTKYNGIPGDLLYTEAPAFGFFVPTTCTGQKGGRNGDGLIHGFSGTQIYAAIMGENALFWNDLYVANMIDGRFASVVQGNSACNSTLNLSSTGISTYLPTSKISNDNFLHVYERNGKNWFMLANINSVIAATGRLTANANIPVIFAYNMDVKIDDGIPTTGNVVAIYINSSQTVTTTAPNAATDSSTTCYNTTGPAYSTSIDNGRNPTCALSFRFN